ncbi:peptidase M24 [Kaistia sp. 32K]|uniref:M24 family metallopeptidase n=1 Tax=Kaistia sp. 32K TaxID=2795690 RepID=UPI001915560D|nr:Xaa-Pro peptidase family protein [Kaistia sp. 32K]BCP55241.1 peptidase M24 [Kaistia sp. 32K]
MLQDMLARRDALPPITVGEYRQRVKDAQALMAENGLDAVFATSEFNFRYFTGDITQGPIQGGRPRSVLIPAKGDPIAVLARGVDDAIRETTWVKDVRSWPGPAPEDEGVTEIIKLVSELTGPNARIGIEMGPESRLGWPVADFLRIARGIAPREFVDANTPVFMRLRQVKSAAEVARIRRVCEIVSEGYARLPQLLKIGETEIDVCRKLEATCYALGVDKTRVVGISERGGHLRTFVGPTDRVLSDEDIMFVDTQCMVDNYTCDFNRYLAFGSVDPASRKAYDLIWQATEAGISAVKPGITASDLWHAMNKVIATKVGANTSNSFGRMGHGMGMTITEYPSIAPDDLTVLKPGMIVKLGPSTIYESHFDGSRKLMIHEEDTVVTETGCELLTRRQPLSMAVITARA